MVQLVHQGEHRVGVLGRALVRLQGDGDPHLARRVADPAEVVDHHAALRLVGRLPRPRDHDRDAEPLPGELGSAAASARPPRGSGCRPRPRCSR